jgi:hypothetical protein
MDIETVIDKVTKLTKNQESSNKIELQAGENVGISKSGKGYIISSTFPESDNNSITVSQGNGITLVKTALDYKVSANLTAGSGITITNGTNNDLIISGGKTYTVQICVNGTPMNLDVLVGKGTQPYPM